MKVSRVVVSRFFAGSRKMPTKHHNAGYYCAVPAALTARRMGISTSIVFRRARSAERSGALPFVAIVVQTSRSPLTQEFALLISCHLTTAERCTASDYCRRLCRLSLRGRNELVRSAAFFVDESLRLPTKCRAVAVALSKTSDPQQR